MTNPIMLPLAVSNPGLLPLAHADASTPGGRSHLGARFVLAIVAFVAALAVSAVIASCISLLSIVHLVWWKAALISAGAWIVWVATFVAAVRFILPKD